MTFFIGNSGLKNVSIGSIDFGNTDYKISKDFNDDKLVKSVKLYGVLDPPVLFKDNNSCIIFAGHNRLHVLRQLEIKNIMSFMINRIDYESFIQYAVLKNFRNEVGQMGKIRFVRLLTDKFALDRGKISHYVKQFRIPPDILYGKDPWDKLNRLTDILRAYIDSKDISFRTIKDILLLPKDAIQMLSDWIKDGMRVNVFRGIIDMLFDIMKRDRSVKILQRIDLDAHDDRRKREEIIFKEIFNVRYPEYSGVKSKADSIIKKLNASGINVNFPEYFEGDEIGINMRVNKREGVEAFYERLTKIDMNLIKALLGFL